MISPQTEVPFLNICLATCNLRGESEVATVKDLPLLSGLRQAICAMGMLVLKMTHHSCLLKATPQDIHVHCLLQDHAVVTEMGELGYLVIGTDHWLVRQVSVSNLHLRCVYSSYTKNCHVVLLRGSAPVQTPYINTHCFFVIRTCIQLFCFMPQECPSFFFFSFYK